MKFPWIRFAIATVLTLFNLAYGYLLNRGFGNGVPSGARDGLALIFVWGSEIMWILSLVTTILIARKIRSIPGFALLVINSLLLIFAFYIFPKTL